MKQCFVGQRFHLSNLPAWVLTEMVILFFSKCQEKDCWQQAAEIMQTGKPTPMAFGDLEQAQI